MFESLKSFGMNIAFIMAFVKIIEMILPEGNLNKYIKFIIGLITTVAIMSPIIVWINGGMEFSFPNIDEYYNDNKKVVSSVDLDSVQEEQVVSLYKTNLETNIKELVGDFNTYTCDSVKCDIEGKDNGDLGQINSVIVYMRYIPVNDNNGVDEIKIKVGEDYDKKSVGKIPKDIEKEILNKIVSTYNIRQADIEVVVAE